jgi:ABC-2 type transport system permease protein
MSIKKALVIAARDFNAYLKSPLIFIVLMFFLFPLGIMFYTGLMTFDQMNMNYSQYQGKGLSITEGITRQFFGNMNVVFLLIAPAITMGLFSEERKQQTIQLLFTAPITISEMVLGKFLAAMATVALLLGSTIVYWIALLSTTNADIGPILTNMLGTFLLVGCYVSIGVLCSSLTESLFVAYISTFAICFFFWIISWIANLAGTFWSEILNYLSIVSHWYNTFSKGVINTSDLVLFFSFMFLFLFLTHRNLDSYRWR